MHRPSPSHARRVFASWARARRSSPTATAIIRLRGGRHWRRQTRASLSPAGRSSDDEAQRTVELALLAKLTVLLVPRPGVEIGGQLPQKPCLNIRADKGPRRVGRAGPRIEQEFGTTVIGLVETIDAVE